MKEKFEEFSEKIKAFLRKTFGNTLNEDEEIMSIGESGVWFSFTEKEITIGSSFEHNHYNIEYSDMNRAVEFLFAVLTQKIKTTQFYRGKYLCRTKTEVEVQDGVYKKAGVSTFIFNPFWKKVKIDVSVQDRLISAEEIRDEIEELMTFAKEHFPKRRL